MADIVERLKSGTCEQGCGTMTACICATAEDAANEIERLQGALEKVHSIANVMNRSPSENDDALWEIHGITRAALTPIEEKTND